MQPEILDPPTNSNDKDVTAKRPPLYELAEPPEHAENVQVLHTRGEGRSSWHHMHAICVQSNHLLTDLGPMASAVVALRHSCLDSAVPPIPSPGGQSQLTFIA